MCLRCGAFDLGAGGLRIGTGKPLSDTPDGTAGNTISDCTFTDGSHFRLNIKWCLGVLQQAYIQCICLSGVI